MKTTALFLLVWAGGCSDGAASAPDLALPPGSDLALPPGADLAGVNPSGIFPPDSPWNTPIDTAPVDPMSDQYIASIGAATGLHPDFDSCCGDGIPFVIVPATQAPVPVTFTAYPDESDPGPYPIPDNAPVEMGGDGHVLVVDPGNGFLYELYQGMRIAGGWTAANGAKWNLATGAPRPQGWTSADAAGLPVFPGLVRYSEVSSGAIHHALRFTVGKTQKGYVAPAEHAAGSCAVNSACPPMGLRVRLRANVDISGFPPQPRVILQALKTYGMFVADNGGDWYVSGEPNANWNDSDLHRLGQIVGSQLEVVKAGAITAYP